MNTLLYGEVECLIKLETPSRKANNDCIAKLEGLLIEKTSEPEHFQVTCGEFEGKLQGSVHVSQTKR